MTFFEYLAIAYSLILSIAVSRVLSGISDALFSERRYWIHLAYVVWLLGSTLIVFWNFWLFRELEWTLPRFMLVLANPALLLVLTTQLMPTVTLDSISWRDHYYGVRQRFCATAALWILVISVTSLALSALPLDHPARLASAVTFLAFILGCFSARPSVQGGIILWNLAGLALMVFWAFAYPGAGQGMVQ
jgi:hypothetical protein